MAEWTGDVSEDQLSDEERIIRRAVMRLVNEGGCDADVAHEVVTGLVAQH